VTGSHEVGGSNPPSSTQEAVREGGLVCVSGSAQGRRLTGMGRLNVLNGFGLVRTFRTAVARR
jgi:hypothetical protein